MPPGIAYPDDTWTWDTLVDVGKQLTIDENGDGLAEQWGFYTETTDMENFWSEAVWQNGGEIISADATQTLLGSDEAVGGLQFFQDLIYTHKIMPTPDLFAETGDAFEQGLAAMESNGSWLVPTHQAAGIDFGIAPLPAGPGRACHQHQPDRRCRVGQLEEPRCCLDVREVARRSRGPGAADAVEGRPARRQVGARGCLRHSLRRLRCDGSHARPRRT